MSNDKLSRITSPNVLRRGQTLLAQAVEAEVAEFLAKHASLRTEDGR